MKGLTTRMLLLVLHVQPAKKILETRGLAVTVMSYTSTMVGVYFRQKIPYWSVYVIKTQTHFVDFNENLFQKDHKTHFLMVKDSKWSECKYGKYGPRKPITGRNV
jgi:K+ transporter